jgi:hypothetical protein
VIISIYLYCGDLWLSDRLGKQSSNSQKQRSIKIKKEKCQDCRYWEQLDSDAREEGECRRYAPRGAGGGLAAYTWNKTKAADWCGDFDRKGSKTIE